MPRHPNVSPSVASIPGSVYSALAHRLAAYQGEVYPLHIGDTWMEPAVGCRMQDLTVEEYPGMHRYSSPQGLRGLLEAIAGRMTDRMGLETEPGSVLVAAGATGALGAVAGAIVEPGAEVLILAPYWPLISGIVRSFHGTPVPVPILGSVDSSAAAVEALDGLLTERTVALYLNTPNNPTGHTLPAPWLEAMTDWARSHELWILADEVYEDYLYTGEHTYTRPLAPERTFSVHSFSKAFGMAGNRCGYVVGPPEVMRELRKVSTHTFYSTPTAAQLAALRALEGGGDRWIAAAREIYHDLGKMAAEKLRVPPPEGSTFLFLDVSSKIDERGLAGFLEDCVERGLFVAPGPSFGPYPNHIRVCFTSAEPEIVTRGIDVLASILYG